MSIIPQRIHYCWFGRGKMSKLQKKCINSWEKFCPDYEVILWNEDNFDINSNIYTKQAYQEKRYAFVSDYARLFVLYNYGGLYFDTDVEIIKPIDRLLDNEAFTAFECDVAVGAGVMGCLKGNALFKEFLDSYKDRTFITDNNTHNTEVIGKGMTKIFINHGLVPNGLKQSVSNCIIYPRTFFYPINVINKNQYFSEDTCIIHYFEGSWFPEEYKRARRHDKNPIILFARKTKLTILYSKIRGFIAAH